MPTATRRIAARKLRYVSQGLEQLVTVFRFYFGPGDVPDLFWVVDERGFHISARIDGENYYPSGEVHWMRRPRSVRDGHVALLASQVYDWLEGLDYEAKRRLCPSTPTEEAYTRDPGLDLVGFMAQTGHSSNEKHRVLTITPEWV